MDQDEMLSHYKWITKIGVIVFVAFSYFYFGPVTQQANQLGDLNEQIEVENSTIDNTNNSATKRQLIQANIARAENAASQSMSLTINRIVVLVFMVLGLGATVFGMMNIRKLVSESEEEEV